MSRLSWADMTADEKLAWRIERWRTPAVGFKSPEAEAGYKARVDRLITALTLGRPDRVPIVLSVGFWPAGHAGMTPYDAMTDPVRARRAWIDFILEFQPDAMTDLRGYTMPISMFEKLDYKLFSWPGHGIPEETGYQYKEQEWMGPDEYDALIADPTGYLLRTYLPRTVGAFAGFSGLSSFLNLIGMPSVSTHVGGWGSPEMLDGLERLTAAAREVDNWASMVFPVRSQVSAMGFPAYRGGVSLAPFDILGDTLRGTKGVILDMFRRPEKVLEACERLVPMAVDWALKSPTPLATPIVFVPLHKGADGFMSDEQFKTFYWPTLRKVILGLIDGGTIPLLFAEGRYDSRLELIMDLPKGRTVWLFDQTDMARAKQTIGRVACLEGNMPLSLLHAGTPAEVAAHTRRLIDVAGEGGGYIMDIGAVADGGRDENLLAMINTTREYGVY
jgi:hypothetical protein